MQLQSFLFRRKYELLLGALLLHLFIGLFVTDGDFYALYIWPGNMLVLGMASIGVFISKGRWKNRIRAWLFFFVLAGPVALPFFNKVPEYFLVLNVLYVLFFAFIFREIFQFLISPGYINADLISASACGYLLLIEISTFLFQFLFYQNAGSFRGISAVSRSAIYMDLVYFSSITLTTIGYGDITPASHHARLATAVFGVSGQFYSVVLVGILISKFSAKTMK